MNRCISNTKWCLRYWNSSLFPLSYSLQFEYRCNKAHVSNYCNFSCKFILLAPSFHFRCSPDAHRRHTKTAFSLLLILSPLLGIKSLFENFSDSPVIWKLIVIKNHSLLWHKNYWVHQETRWGNTFFLSILQEKYLKVCSISSVFLGRPSHGNFMLYIF